ncbi:MAG: DUF6268 family outer membrane beta-barrel protein [Planctomycetaceae bacterium]|nr:DUF6268 family outer membrane beta-barrel protein [Planctomycetaceae bacterium]
MMSTTHRQVIALRSLLHDGCHRLIPLVFAISVPYLTCTVGFSQVVRLPAVVEPEQGPPGQLLSHPDSSSQILQSPGETGVSPATPPPGQPTLPPGVRNGFFQKALFDYTWLAPGGANGLGMNDVQLQSIFAMPCPTIDSPLVITPGAAVHYLEGPRNADLPPRLHEGYVDFRWLSQINSKLGLDLAVTPGIYSDFEQASNKGFRLQSHAAAAWTWNETTKFVVGAAYLDRPDIEAIPIGGVIWMPQDDVKFDLVFPHPRASHRIRWFNAGGDAVQDWAYVSGEFTGDAWAVAGPGGVAEQVMLSDYRLILGVEQKVAGGLSSRVEVGYVFGRHIKYTGPEPDFYPTDTVMFRGGLTY